MVEVVEVVEGWRGGGWNFFWFEIQTAREIVYLWYDHQGVPGVVDQAVRQFIFVV